MENLEQYKGGVVHCPDGKYRWLYEYAMLKNPTIFFTILKIFLVCACAPALIVVLASLGREGIYALVSGAKVYGMMMLIFIPLSLLSYLVVAAIYGWKYIVLFEMDDAGIVHIQQPRQFQKAQGIAWLAVLAGVARRQGGVTNIGVSVASKNASTTEFRRVRSVRGLRRRNTIKLNQKLMRNQVYVQPADYDFVWNYIIERCANAKIR